MHLQWGLHLWATVLQNLWRGLASAVASYRGLLTHWTYLVCNYDDFEFCGISMTLTEHDQYVGDWMFLWDCISATPWQACQASTHVRRFALNCVMVRSAVVCDSSLLRRTVPVGPLMSATRLVFCCKAGSNKASCWRSRQLAQDNVPHRGSAGAWSSTG